MYDTMKEEYRRSGWLHMYQMQSFATERSLPPFLVRGEGIYVTDQNGKRYIDGLSGAYCTSVGYGKTSVLDAAREAALDIHFVSPFSSANAKAAELASVLSSLAEPVLGKDARVFFVNGGGEGVDHAMKIARAYKKRIGQHVATAIVGRMGAYHGATFGAMSVCGIDGFFSDFSPLLPDVHFMPTYTGKMGSQACLDGSLSVLDELGPRLCAMLIEPVDSSIVEIPPREFFKSLSEACATRGCLRIYDEVVTGMGRMGSWLAAEHYGVEGDIVVLAKGLTGGYESLGAVIVRREIADVFWGTDAELFYGGSTFGGRPAAAATALEVIKIIQEENLLANTRANGQALLSRLKRDIADIPGVKAVRGDGLLCCVELGDQPRSATGEDAPFDLSAALLRNGLITSVYVDRLAPNITLAPPLIISERECALIIEALRAALMERSQAGKMLEV